jgi:hypothetical protein
MDRRVHRIRHNSAVLLVSRSAGARIWGSHLLCVTVLRLNTVTNCNIHITYQFEGFFLSSTFDMNIRSFTSTPPVQTGQSQTTAGPIKPVPILTHEFRLRCIREVK